MWSIFNDLKPPSSIIRTRVYAPVLECSKGKLISQRLSRTYFRSAASAGCIHKIRLIPQGRLDVQRLAAGESKVVRQDATAEEGWTGDDRLLPRDRHGPRLDRRDLDGEDEISRCDGT